jgi:hypothetical protein
MESTITFNELEWRSDALGASAGRTIASVARQPRLAVLHYRSIRGLHSISSAMNDLLETIHASDSIEALESAPVDRLEDLGRKLLEGHDKVRTAILQIKSLDLGFWRKAYSSSLQALEHQNQILGTHAAAFANSGAPLVLLSERDQAYLLESLASPNEPNEALRRAFARR